LIFELALFSYEVPSGAIPSKNGQVVDAPPKQRRYFASKIEPFWVITVPVVFSTASFERLFFENIS
jgi:hypothetical protein